jgi:hypothetical protein
MITLAFSGFITGLGLGFNSLGMRGLAGGFSSIFFLGAREVMQTYHVRNDIGSRYGSRNDSQTLKFIRYWDAACRYILTILDLNQNWNPDVDVWGIPHLINNSLGGWLRLERGPVICSNCNSHMYMATEATYQPQNIQVNGFPYCIFVCPNCLTVTCRAFNI